MAGAEVVTKESLLLLVLGRGNDEVPALQAQLPCEHPDERPKVGVLDETLLVL